MSRSRKRLPITGIAAGTDKTAMRRWNRSFRHRTRRLVERTHYFDAVALPINIHKETKYWDGPKETKVWMSAWPKAFRK